MEMVWRKLHATWRNQGSLHSRVLGNAFKMQYFGEIWSSLKRKACNFTKHGHMQSFSTTHNLRLALRKRYVWKHRRSSTKRFARLQDCHGLYSSWTRNVVNKIYEAETQDHLGAHQAIRRVTRKPGTASLTSEFLAYHFRQSNSRVQHVKTRSRSWSRRNPSFRTWARRRRSTSSVKNRRNWSPTWTTQRSSNLQCPECNTYWKSEKSIAVVENMKSSQRPTEVEQNNYDVTSIPGYVIKNNSSRGAKHGRTFWTTKMYTRRNRCWKRPKRTELRCHWSGGEK